MRVERQLLTNLLRSRGNHETAEPAARPLPATIDFASDRFLLRQCGIDADAVAMDLSSSDRDEPAPRPADAMLDHVSPHLGRASQFGAVPSVALAAMPAWQADAALSDLKRSMRQSRLPRLVRVWLKRGLLSIIVLAAGAVVVALAAGRPMPAMTLSFSALLLADGRPVRYLRRLRAGRAHQPRAE